MNNSNKDYILISAKGHENILSLHKTTWQITKENHLSRQGDCIIGVSSTMGCADLPKWMKIHLQNFGKIKITLTVGEFQYTGTAEGHPDLLLGDELDMVFRKSSFVSPRTIAVNSSFVAKDLPSEMIEQLQDPKSILEIKIEKY